MQRARIVLTMHNLQLITLTLPWALARLRFFLNRRP